jgi:hypothetical protein
MGKCWIGNVDCPGYEPREEAMTPNREAHYALRNAASQIRETLPHLIAAHVHATTEAEVNPSVDFRTRIDTLRLQAEQLESDMVEVAGPLPAHSGIS